MIFASRLSPRSVAISSVTPVTPLSAARNGCARMKRTVLRLLMRVDSVRRHQNCHHHLDHVNHHQHGRKLAHTVRVHTMLPVMVMSMARNVSLLTHSSVNQGKNLLLNYKSCFLIFVLNPISITAFIQLQSIWSK